MKRRSEVKIGDNKKRNKRNAKKQTLQVAVSSTSQNSSKVDYKNFDLEQPIPKTLILILDGLYSAVFSVTDCHA